jgi:FSR family fosmidomycin resistance protein-like MFS transporter
VKSEIKNLCVLTSVAGRRALRPPVPALLAVEFLDELTFGTGEASLPLVRDDLALGYAEIGLLLSLPRLLGNLVELPVGIAAETVGRRALIVGGGSLYALSLALVAAGGGFWSLLLALMLLHPAAGAFVGLSQAVLMDAVPARREQNMARWAFAGSAAQAAGSLAVGAAVALGAGWRTLYAALAVCALAALLPVVRFPLDARAAGGGDEQTADGEGARGGDDDIARAAVGNDARTVSDNRARESGDGESDRSRLADFRGGAAGAWRALRRREVARCLALLELADLMLDGFHGFIALYFVDAVGLAEGRAATAVAVWTGVGLAGGLLVIPLLERVRGLAYLRWSALAALVLLPAFLLAPGVAPKLVVLALLGVGNAGWYAILKARLYAAMPGRSSTAMSLHSAAGLAGGLVPLALGLFAERFGIAAMMWLLLASPLSLLALIPRERRAKLAPEGAFDDAGRAFRVADSRGDGP